MMWKKMLGAAAVVIVVSFFLYCFIGGMKSLSYSVITLPKTELRGEWFEGKPTSPKLEDLFIRMRDKVSFSDSAYLAVVTVDTGKKDTIRQFIGVLNRPAGSEVYRLNATRYVDVALDMHPAVRPSPEKVREGAEALAVTSGSALSGVEIQVFTSENGFRILFPVQD